MPEFIERLKQKRCFILLINETSKRVNIYKAKTEEGLIHYKKKTWLVQTNPLLYKNRAFYIVSDRQIPSFLIEFKEEEEDGEVKSNPEPIQQAIKAEQFSPSTLQKVATNQFFQALMAPLYWSRADWLKAIAVGFTFYMTLKWILLSVFKVPLP